MLSCERPSAFGGNFDCKPSDQMWLGKIVGSLWKLTSLCRPLEDRPAHKMDQHRRQWWIWESWAIVPCRLGQHAQWIEVARRGDLAKSRSGSVPGTTCRSPFRANRWKSDATANSHWQLWICLSAGRLAVKKVQPTSASSTRKRHLKKGIFKKYFLAIFFSKPVGDSGLSSTACSQNSNNFAECFTIKYSSSCLSWSDVAPLFYISFSDIFKKCVHKIKYRFPWFACSLVLFWFRWVFRWQWMLSFAINTNYIRLLTHLCKEKKTFCCIRQNYFIKWIDR